jgi:hypothetical protein
MGRSRLGDVKMLRVCLLLMLVVLLPWRGAVAAAMLCPSASMPASLGAQGHHDAPGTPSAGGAPHWQAEHHGHSGHHDLDHRQAVTGDAIDTSPVHQTHDQPPPSTDGKCQLCAATCALSTLPPPASDLPQPPAMAASAFPPLVAPAPDFLSGGQERPPRSS